MRRKNLDATVVTTDLGYAKGGRNYAAALGFSLAFVEKRRVGNEVGREALTLIGSVAGKDVLIVDDLVDTAGSVSYTHLDVYKRQVRSLSGVGVRKFEESCS